MKKLKMAVTLIALSCTFFSYGQDFVDAFRVGGIEPEYARGIAITGDGIVVLTGTFVGTVDFDPSNATAELTSVNSSYDAYIAWYTQAMGFFTAVSIGGTSNDYSYDVAVNQAGEAVICGFFEGEIGLGGSGGTTLTSNGTSDVFVAKYGTAGELIWAFNIGAEESDNALTLTLDDAGNIFITGQFMGTVDFDPSPEVAEMTSATFSDLYIASYTGTGDYRWSSMISGPPNKLRFCNGLTTDSEGNLLVTGFFEDSLSLDPGSGSAYQISNGGYDVYLAKYDPSGKYMWSMAFGSEWFDYGRTVNVDHNDNVFIGGSFEGEMQFDPSGVAPTVSPAGDEAAAFLAKYDSDGNYLWVNHMTGTGSVEIQSVCFDTEGNSFVAGKLYGTADFDPSANVAEMTSFGNWDGWFGRYSADGNYQWAGSVGGSDTDYGYDLAVLDDEYVFGTGFFMGLADFDPGEGDRLLNARGSFDIYLVKLTAVAGAGIDDNTYVEVAEVYPVPATGSLSVRIEDNEHESLEVEIMSLAGQLLYKATLSGQGEHSIPLTGMAQGTYILNLKKDSRTIQRQKFIISF